MIKPAVHKIVPPGESGNCRIEHFTVSKKEAQFSGLMGAIHGDGDAYVEPGRYCKLTVSGALMMTDTQMEWRTGCTAIHHAKGNVLIGGLGIGMLLGPILMKPEVSTVLVIEKSEHVIRLVAPHYEHRKLRVINADIFTWQPPEGEKYDAIWFDIWAEVSTDTLAEMATLKRRYAKRLNRPDGWMGCWKQDYLRYRREQERRAGW